MHNPLIHPSYLYGPQITWALSEWSDETIYLSFDPTMLWNQFCVMRLSVVYRGRAIPRFDIEENFLDDKSNGFNREKSGLRDPLALSRLCLVLSVATLTLQGTAAVEASLRRWVDVHTYRGMSYLKIGWAWVTSNVRKGWTLLTPAPLKTNRDPDPVMSSRNQDSARRLRLEFQVFKVKTC
jgi:hypothetical protein